MPLASVVLMLIAGIASPPANAAPATHEVVIEGMRFKPDSLTVHRGDRVVWRNKDIVPHTATAGGTGAGVFDSHTIPAGGSWTHVAGKRGTVPYVCTMHPTMKGTLTVQ